MDSNGFPATGLTGRIHRITLSGIIAACLGLFVSTTFAQTAESLQFSMDAYDRLFSTLAPGQTDVAIGDMMFRVETLRNWRDYLQAQANHSPVKEGAFDFKNSLSWPNSTVPYFYDKSMPSNSIVLVEAAMREWQLAAGINFVPKKSSDKDYLYFQFSGSTNNAPMNSFIGRQGGSQVINIAGWGNKIDCAHEIGHSLGMIHEQCRSDRDTYVTILTNNLSSADANGINFALVPGSLNSTTYDYDSLMHYPAYADGIDPSLPTMAAKPPNQKWSDGVGPDEIGQKTHLSAGDKAAMALVYGNPISILGRVVDAANSPLAGVQVTISGGGIYRGPATVATDTNGNYSFVGLARNSGVYSVSASQPGTSFTVTSRSITVGTNDATAQNFTAIDSAPPDLVINVPAVSGIYATVPTASGTASDAVGLKMVRVALARTSDLVWWNWQTNGWGSTTFNFADNAKTATGTKTWSSTLPSLSVGGYQVHVQSVDLSDNASPWRFRHFFVDPEPPSVTVSEPLNKSVVPTLKSIHGTASDGSGTGISNNVVHFTLFHDGSFWNGFNWKANTTAQDPEVLLSADVVGGLWNYDFLPEGRDDAIVPAGDYALSVFAQDNAGNFSTPASGLTSVIFTIDNTPPTIAIASPATGTTLSNLTVIAGTASDTKNLAGINLYIYRFRDGRFWDGTSFGGGGSAILPVSLNSSNGTWTSTGPLPSVANDSSNFRLSNGDYDIIAFAVDSAGNQKRIDSVVHVEFYRTFTYTAGSLSDSNPFNNNESWDNPDNWDLLTVPGPEDDVIIAAGSPRISGTNSVHKLTLSGGNLIGPLLSVPPGGSFVFSGGTLSANLLVNPQGSLVITGSTDKVISSGIHVENDGDSSWTGNSSILGSGNVLFQNNGVINADGNINFVYVNNGVSPIGRLENVGTFNNTGTNTIHFLPDYGGWVLTNSGSLNIAGGTVLLNNTAYLAGSISGAGRILAQGAALHLEFTNTLNGGTVELNSGTIDGTGLFDGNGTFVWSGGAATGDFRIGTSASFLVAGTDDKTIASGARISTAGHAHWTAGKIIATGNSRLENSGTFEMTSNVAGVYINNGVSPRGEFINTGVVQKTGTGTVMFVNDYGGWHLNNRGELDVNAGVLALNGGGVHQGVFAISPGARLDLGAGEPHVFAGASTISGGGRVRVVDASVVGSTGLVTVAAGGTFEMAGGVATGTMSVAGPGTFEWSGGTLNAALTFLPSANTVVSGTGDKYLDAGHLTQNGTLTITGPGFIHALGGAEFRNGGTMDLQAGAGFVYQNNGVIPVGSFINTGTLRKTAITNATLFAPDYGGWVFTNIGVVDIQTGRLDLNIDNASFGDGGTVNGTGEVRVIGGNALFYGTNTISTGTIELSNGNLSSSGGVVAGPGTFLWTGGAANGSTTIGVTNFLISGSNDKTINSGATVRNSGRAVWSGGAIRVTGASLFDNTGRFEARNDSAFFYLNNGVSPVGAFANSGQFIKAAGADTSFASDYGGANFNNSGLLSVDNGVLSLGGGGLWNNGSVSTTNGGELHLFNGNFQLTNSTTFSGLTRINGGTVTLLNSTNSIVSGGLLTLDSGLVAGSGGFAGLGSFGWTAGTVNGSLTIGTQTQLAFDGSGEKSFDRGIIDLLGSATWTSNGTFRALGNTVFYNHGTFNIRGDVAFTYLNNGVVPVGRFVNYGVLAKNSSSGVSAFAPDYGGWEFDNAGTLQIDSGVLSLRNTSYFSNNVVNGSGRVRLDGGGVIFSGTTTFGNSGTFELASGIATGSNNIAGTGKFEWSGGDLDGVQNVTASGNFLISGTGDKSFRSGASFSNNGLVAWLGNCRVIGIGATRWTNNGILSISSDATLAYLNNGFGPAYFENNGLIQKLGAGQVSFAADYGGWNFVNKGTLEVRSGTFYAGPTYQPAASTQTKIILGGIDPGPLSGNVVIPGNANFLGTLSVQLTNNFVPSTNVIYSVVSYGTKSGQYSSPSLPLLPSGLSWNLDYTDTALNLSVVPSVRVTLDKLSKSTDGKFQLTVTGPTATSLTFQSSTNLINWVDLQVAQPFTGSQTFIDTGATNSHKFYRTFLTK